MHYKLLYNSRATVRIFFLMTPLSAGHVQSWIIVISSVWQHHNIHDIRPFALWQHHNMSYWYVSSQHDIHYNMTHVLSQCDRTITCHMSLLSVTEPKYVICPFSVWQHHNMSYVPSQCDSTIICHMSLLSVTAPYVPSQYDITIIWHTSLLSITAP